MNGALPGVASSIMIFPDDKLIVVGLANLTGDPHKIATAAAKKSPAPTPGWMKLPSSLVDTSTEID